MPPATQVQSLRLEATSGTTLYPGENGFSAVWGEVESDDPALTDALDRMATEATSVTLRCGMLEVTGRLQEPQTEDGRRCYRISVQGVHFGSNTGNVA
jgi:hypothetical protein